MPSRYDFLLEEPAADTVGIQMPEPPKSRYSFLLDEPEPTAPPEPEWLFNPPAPKEILPESEATFFDRYTGQYPFVVGKNPEEQRDVMRQMTYDRPLPPPTTAPSIEPPLPFAATPATGVEPNPAELDPLVKRGIAGGLGRGPLSLMSMVGAAEEFMGGVLKTSDDPQRDIGAMMQLVGRGLRESANRGSEAIVADLGPPGGRVLWGKGEEAVTTEAVVDDLSASVAPLMAVIFSAGKATPLIARGITKPMGAVLSSTAIGRVVGLTMEKVFPRLAVKSLAPGAVDPVITTTAGLVANGLFNSLYGGVSQYEQAKNRGVPEGEARREAATAAALNLATVLTGVAGAVPGQRLTSRVLIGAVQGGIENTYRNAVHRIASGTPVAFDREAQLATLTGIFLGIPGAAIRQRAANRTAEGKYEGPFDFVFKFGSSEAKAARSQAEVLLAKHGEDFDAAVSAAALTPSGPLAPKSPTAEPKLGQQPASQPWEPAAGGGSLMEQAYGDPAEAIRFLRAEAGVRGFTEAQVDRLVQGATTPAGYERMLARVMARPAREAAGIGRRTVTPPAPPAPPAATTPPESLVPGSGAPASVSPPEAVTTTPTGQPDLPTPAEMAALEESLSRSTIPVGQQQKLLAGASRSRKMYEGAVVAARQRQKPEAEVEPTFDIIDNAETPVQLDEIERQIDAGRPINRDRLLEAVADRRRALNRPPLLEGESAPLTVWLTPEEVKQRIEEAVRAIDPNIEVRVDNGRSRHMSLETDPQSGRQVFHANIDRSMELQKNLAAQGINPLDRITASVQEEILHAQQGKEGIALSLDKDEIRSLEDRWDALPEELRLAVIATRFDLADKGELFIDGKSQGPYKNVQKARAFIEYDRMRRQVEAGGHITELYSEDEVGRAAAKTAEEMIRKQISSLSEQRPAAPPAPEAAVAPPKVEEPAPPAPERSDRVQTWQKAVADAEQPATLDDALRSIATDTGLSSDEKASLVETASLKRQELVGRQQPVAVAPPAGPRAPAPKPAQAEVQPAEQPAAVAMEQPEPEEAPVAAPPPPVVHGFRDDQQLKRYVLEMGSPRDLDPETLARLRGAGFKYNPRRQWWAAQPSEVAKALGEELAGQKITFSNEKSARLPRTNEGAHRLSLAQITRGQLDPREVGRIVGMMGEPDDPRVKNKGYFKRFTGGRVSMEEFIAEGLADAEVGAVLRAHDIHGPEDVEKLAKALSNPEVARRQVSVSAQALEQDARAAEDVLGQQEQDWLKQTLVETKALKERLAGISDEAALEVFSNEYVDALGRASSIGWGPKKIEVQTMAVAEAVRSRSRELSAAKAAPLSAATGVPVAEAAAEPVPSAAAVKPESGPTPAAPIFEPTPEPPAEKAAALIAAYRDGSRQLTAEDVAALDADLLPAFIEAAKGFRAGAAEGLQAIKEDQSRLPALQELYQRQAEDVIRKYDAQIKAAESRMASGPEVVQAPEAVAPPAEVPAPAGPAFSLEQESAAEPPKRPVLADQPLGLELPRRQLPATALKGGGQGLEGVELAAAGEAEAAAEASRAQEALSFEPVAGETPEEAVRVPERKWAKQYAATSLFGITEDQFAATPVPEDINMGSGAHDGYVYGWTQRLAGKLQLPPHKNLSGGTTSAALKGFRAAEDAAARQQAEADMREAGQEPEAEVPGVREQGQKSGEYGVAERGRPYDAVSRMVEILRREGYRLPETTEGGTDVGTGSAARPVRGAEEARETSILGDDNVEIIRTNLRSVRERGDLDRPGDSEKTVFNLHGGGEGRTVLTGNRESPQGEESTDEIRQGTGGGELPAVEGDLTRGFKSQAQREEQASGYVSLSDKTIKSLHDAALVAQVFRDPRVEHSRYIYIGRNSGRVLAHEGFTSRIANATIPPIYAGKKAWSIPERVVRNKQEMAMRVNRLSRKYQEPVDIILLHNHPSGNSVPSESDIGYLEAMKRKLPATLNLLGQVVINSGEYSVVSPDLTTTTYDLETNNIIGVWSTEEQRESARGGERVASRVAGDALYNPLRRGAGGRFGKGGLEEVVRLGQELKMPGKMASFIYLGVNDDIKGHEGVNLTVLRNVVRANDFIGGRLSAFGAVRTIIYYDGDRISQEELFAIGRGLSQLGLVKEVLYLSPGLAPYSRSAQAAKAMDFQERPPEKLLRIAEEGKPVSGSAADSFDPDDPEQWDALLREVLFPEAPAGPPPPPAGGPAAVAGAEEPGGSGEPPGPEAEDRHEQGVRTLAQKLGDLLHPQRRVAPEIAAKHPELIELMQMDPQAREAEKMMEGVLRMAVEPDSFGDEVRKALDSKKAALLETVSDSRYALGLMVRMSADLAGIERVPIEQDPFFGAAFYDQNRVMAERSLKELSYIIKRGMLGKAIDDLSTGVFWKGGRPDPGSFRTRAAFLKAEKKWLNKTMGDLTRFSKLSAEDTAWLGDFIRAKEIIRREGWISARMQRQGNQKAEAHRTEFERKQREKMRWQGMNKVGIARDLPAILEREFQKPKYQGQELPLTKEELIKLNPDGKDAAWARNALVGIREAVGGEKFARLERTASWIGKMTRRELRLDYEAGLLSPESYEEMLDNQMIYGPYLGPYQVIEYVAENINDASRLPKTMSVSDPVIKMMVGTDKLVRPLLETLPSLIYRHTSVRERNKIMQNIYNLRDLHPDVKQVIRDLPTDTEVGVRKATYSSGERERLASAGLEGQDLAQAVAKLEAVEFAKPEYQSAVAVPEGFGAVHYFVDGQLRSFALPLPVAEVVQGMDRQQADMMARMFSKFAGALRAGQTTYSPTFAFVNPLNDLWTQAGKAEHPLNPFRPKDFALLFNSWTQALAESVGGRPSLQEQRFLRELDRYGGAYTGRSDVYEPAQQMNALLRGYWGNLRDNPLPTAKNSTGGVVSLVTEGLDRSLGAFSAAGEQMTRRSLFKKYKEIEQRKLQEQLKKSGATKPISLQRQRLQMEATMEAIEGSINFRRGGKAFRYASSYMPFKMAAAGYARAAIQGAFAHRLRTALIGAATMVVAGGLRVAMWKMFGDLVNDIDPSEKERKFEIPLNSTPVMDYLGELHIERLKLPKAGLTAMFANPTEDFVDYVYSGKHDVPGSIFEALDSLDPFGVVYQGEVDVVRAGTTSIPLLNAIIGTATPQGWDAYRARALMTPEEASRNREDQWNPYTTMGARKIGALGAWIYGKDNGWSPIKIDFATRAVFGETGLAFLEYVAGQPAERRELSNAERLGAAPVIKGFYSVRGGHLRSMMFEAMNKAAKETASDKFAIRQEVGELIRDWTKITPQERGRRLKEAQLTKEEHQAFLNALEQQRKGFGEGDSVYGRLQMAGIENGERAAMIRNIYNEVHRTAGARKAFDYELARHRLNPPIVRRQLAQMALNGEIEPPRDEENVASSRPVPVEPPDRERAKKLQPSIFDY